MGVVVVVALATATSASSRPTAGISVTAQEPITAIIGAADPSGILQYAIVVSARFSPEVLHDDVRVSGISIKPKGLGFAPFTGYDQGNVLHTTAVYQASFAAWGPDRILITAKWNAYTPQVSGTVSGSKTATTVIEVPKSEPAPRLVSERKQRLASQSTDRYAVCAIAAIAGGVTVEIPPLAIVFAALAAESCAAGVVYHNMALDPIDLNFRIVAKPKTPSAPKVAAGQGLSAAAAASLSKLLSLQAKEIGLGRAIVTAFNRSQGAHVKKQTDWEKKQVRAAGTYASALSSLMLAEAQLRPSVRRALSRSVEVSEEAAYAFQDSLVARRSLPAGLAASLSKLGLTKAELREVHAQLVVRNHPTLYDVNAVAAIADPLDLRLLRQTATDLKAFAKKAAKDPLNTGT
jgi:hypothetical protein